MDPAWIIATGSISAAVIAALTYRMTRTKWAIEKEKLSEPSPPPIVIQADGAGAEMLLRKISAIVPNRIGCITRVYSSYNILEAFAIGILPMLTLLQLSFFTTTWQAGSSGAISHLISTVLMAVATIIFFKYWIKVDRSYQIAFENQETLLKVREALQDTPWSENLQKIEVYDHFEPFYDNPGQEN